MGRRPYLLDVTRLIALGWTGKQPTGIERVCVAYLGHYRNRAQAVVQHRGVFRIFDNARSDTLFDLLVDRSPGFRTRLVARAPGILSGGKPMQDCQGQIYLNVGHTEFDLASHQEWVKACRLQPVYLIHDLIPIDNSAICSAHATRRHLGRVVNALGAAAGIIVNSQATATDLRTFAQANALRLPPVQVAHLAGQALDRTLVRRVAGKRHFVCVGTIEPRKNHMLLMRIWQRLVQRLGDAAPVLVLVGQWGAYSDPVRQLLAENSALAAHVRVMHACDDAAMAGWINTATAMLLPTLAEGFGLPVVEAMSLGVPVVASDIPSFREIGRNIPLLLDPANDTRWETAILDFMNHGYEARRQRGLLASYRATTWADHFACIDSWLPGLVGSAAFQNHGSPPTAQRTVKVSQGRGPSRPAMTPYGDAERTF